MQNKGLSETFSDALGTSPAAGAVKGVGNKVSGVVDTAAGVKLTNDAGEMLAKNPRLATEVVKSAGKAAKQSAAGGGADTVVRIQGLDLPGRQIEAKISDYGINPKKIDLSDYNLDRVKEYRKAIRDGGTLEPAIIISGKGGEYLHDGHHRALAYALEGQKTMPAVVTKKNVLEEAQRLNGHVDKDLHDIRTDVTQSGRTNPVTSPVTTPGATQRSARGQSTGGATLSGIAATEPYPDRSVAYNDSINNANGKVKSGKQISLEKKAAQQIMQQFGAATAPVVRQTKPVETFNEYIRDFGLSDGDDIRLANRELLDIGSKLIREAAEGAGVVNVSDVTEIASKLPKAQRNKVLPIIKYVMDSTPSSITGGKRGVDALNLERKLELFSGINTLFCTHHEESNVIFFLKKF